MTAPGERKVVLVTRRTRLEELLAQYHTHAHAKFYIEHLGADFSDYLVENAAYAASLQTTVRVLEAWGRYQVIDRSHLPNMIFGASDIVVALGQDGIVANTMKYLDGQPLLGVNPEPSRYDGVLLPFVASDLELILGDVARNRRPMQAVTMAEVRLSDGQALRAVNDLFVGPRSHTSALYDIGIGEQWESQSSSGVIIATGLGSTAWIKSIVTGSLGIARSLQALGKWEGYRPAPWDSPALTFAVREPFPSKSSSTNLVLGQVSAAKPLRLRSRMPDNGVIFSDGIEADFLRFTAGMEATVSVADCRGQLAL